jgi:hypothetical protein
MMRNVSDDIRNQSSATRVAEVTQRHLKKQEEKVKVDRLHKTVEEAEAIHKEEMAAREKERCP